MAKFAAEDLSRLENEPAWHALVENLRALMVNLLETNARSLKRDEEIERAERLGQVHNIEYVLTWMDGQRKQLRISRLKEQGAVKTE